jgi:hypothetical protein
MSFGIVTSYLFSVSKVNVGQAPNFGDKIELRKFGTHLGFRYFCTEVFDVFTAGLIPVASYKTSSVNFDKLHNQFVFNICTSFNL